MPAPASADLLVAESRDMLPKIAAALEPHSVHAVHDGREAKAALEALAFDMVMIGAHLPDGAMLDVLRFAASLERCRSTPIICIRTRELWLPMPGLARTAKALGADALMDFSSHASEGAALGALARLVRDFLRCEADEPADQIWLALDAAVAHFGADCGTVQLYDTAARRLRVVAQRNCAPGVLSLFEDADDSRAACGTAMKRRQRVVVGDVASDPLLERGEARQRLLDGGVAALHATPLFSRPARLRGMLSLHYGTAQRPSEAQFAYADVLARRMAGSLSMM